ncbi:hypothetical protein QU38_00550, partial [Staphylococcus aureus]
MRANGQFDVSSSIFARPIRAVSTKWAGVVPVSLWNEREKVRSLMPALMARTGPDRSPAGSSRISVINFRSRGVALTWTARLGLN